MREQLARLTGLSNPGGHASHEAQYRALLEAGATVAQEWGLVPGVALSAEQMAALTTDIVWLVRQTVTLPDGNSVEVLAPQVYARVRSGDLDGTGALIAGRDVTINVAGDMLNQGRILALDTATLRTGNLHNLGGQIFATDAEVQAAGDIVLLGGAIGGARSLDVQAARDLTIAAATYATTGDTGTRSGISRGASLYVTDPQAELFAGAGRDLNLAAGNVINRNGGHTVLVAGRDINLATLLETRQDTVASSEYSLRVQTEALEAGSHIDTTGILVLAAGRDLATRGADIAGGDVTLHAERDVSIAAAEHTVSVARDSTDRVSGRVSTWRLEQRAIEGTSIQGESVTIAAGQDQHHVATHIAAADSITLASGGDLTLSTATAIDSRDAQRGDGRNWRTEQSTFEIGSHIDAGGDIALVAAQELLVRGVQVTSDAGTITAQAGRDLTVEASQDTYDLDAATYKKRSGLLSSKTTITRTTADQTTHQGALLSGEAVTATAARDLSVHGSQIVSTDTTVLAAGRDLTIEAATDTLHESHMRSEKTSGIFSGGIGFTIGKREIASDAGNTHSHASASTVGSVEGDVTLLAGQNYRQVGSDVLAPQGNIDIAAERVDILEARESSLHTQETKTKQSGLTIAITAPVITAVQTAQQMHSASKDTGDGRMKALAGSATALAAADAYVQTNSNAAGGANLTLSIGGSKSRSTSTYTTDTASASTVAGGGDVTIRASGAGEQSDITVQGSRIDAERDLTLIADDDIALLAAANTATQRNNNKSSSASVGISIGSNTGFTLGVSMERGQADGDDLAWSNAHLSSGETLTLRSGCDTTLKGAVASGERVVAEVGGGLTIESLQDASTYDAQQKNAGFSITIGAGIPTGGIHSSKSKTDSTYASVTEQSAIRAGDGGFDVRVEGHTELKGGAISSTQPAIEAGNNRLVTGTLTTTDLRNQSEGNATSSGFSLSSDIFSQGKYGVTKSVIGNASNNASASDSATGETRAAVSAGLVEITDEAQQMELTGQSAEAAIASLNRDTSTAHTAAQRQDIDALERTVEAERAIKEQTIKMVTVFTDEAYRSRFQQQPKLLKGECPPGANCIADPSMVIYSYATEEDIKNADLSKIMAVNGMENDEMRAIQLGYQNILPDEMGNKPTTFYVMHIAPANNFLSELLGVAYEKITASADYGLAYFLGYTTGQEVYAALLRSQGQQEVLSLGHSRGTLIQEAAFTILANRPDESGNLYTNPYLSVRGVAGAADAVAWSNKAIQLIGDQNKNQVTYNYFSNDPVSVSVFAGGNPGVWTLKDLWQVITTDNSMHSCGGTGAPGCTQVERPVAGGPQGTPLGNAKLILYMGGQQVDANGNPVQQAK